MKTNKYNGKKTTQTFKFTIKHSTELLKVYIKFFCKNARKNIQLNLLYICIYIYIYFLPMILVNNDYQNTL